MPVISSCYNNCMYNAFIENYNLSQSLNLNLFSGLFSHFLLCHPKDCFSKPLNWIVKTCLHSVYWYYTCITQGE